MKRFTSIGRTRSQRLHRFEQFEQRNLLSAVPAYSSNLDSLNKVFLDFDGHVVTDSLWTNPTYDNFGNIVTVGNIVENVAQPIHAPVYNIPGDSDYEFDPANEVWNPLPFSQQELDYIELAWKYIAEDLAPFDVDVTTVEPPPEYFTSGGPNGEKALRVLFTSGLDDGRINGTANVGNNWLGQSKDWVGRNYSGIGNYDSWVEATQDRPVWVFANQLNVIKWNHPDEPDESPNYTWGPIQEYLGMIGSHEIGHGLGLYHDSVDTNNALPSYQGDATYYGGHGSGETSWGPIMGGAELRNLTQWSYLEYKGATQEGGGSTEDDLSIIAGHLGYRADDHGNDTTVGSATFLDASQGAVSASGIIGGSSYTSNGNDIDVFRFDAGSSLVDIIIQVDPAWVGPNLDIELKIYDADDLLNPVTVNPDLAIDAGYSFTGSGEYYLSIDGVGRGDVLGDGYSDYGSLGQYTVRVSTGPPRVTDVVIANTDDRYSHSFAELLEPTAKQNIGLQLLTIPVPNANSIAITFSQPMDSTTLESALIVQDLTSPDLVNFTTINHSGFIYDSDTWTGAWSFSTGALPGLTQLLLRLDDQLAKGANGQLLDGEWVNPTSITTTNVAQSEFPSGNGAEGGDFHFIFTTLVPTTFFDPDDNHVNNNDLTALLDNWEISTPQAHWAKETLTGTALLATAT